MDAETMGNEQEKEIHIMPMRSDERLATRIAKEIIPLYRPRSVLDVGCGDGVIYETLESSVRYQGLDITGARIYKQRHDNPQVEYVAPDLVQERMGEKNTWEMVLLLDVIEHTKAFTPLFDKALDVAQKYILVSLPNELFYVDRIRMLMGKELNAHSLDLIKMPDGFKHQYIINIEKAKRILESRANSNGFSLKSEVLRPLKPKSGTNAIINQLIKVMTTSHAWSMGSVLVFEKDR